MRINTDGPKAQGADKPLKTAEKRQKTTKRDIVVSILRMSQKALACVLAMIGAGYIGGMIAIVARPEIADELTRYASAFTGVWQLEIGVYGLGSTLENVTKVRKQLNDFNAQGESEEGESNG